MQRSLSPSQLILCVAIFICATANFSFWQALFTAVNWHEMQGILFLISQILTALSLTVFFIALFSWHTLLKPACIVFLLAAAVAAYFMDTLGTIINVLMVQNIFETDTHEASELFTAKLALYVLALGILPSIAVWLVPLRMPRWKTNIGQQAFILLISFAIAASTTACVYKQFSIVHRQHKMLRLQLNPVAPILSFIRYFVEPSASSKNIRMIAADAHQSLAYTKKPHKSLVIFVLGETARADNFQLNGYARNTNPLLSNYPIINFSNTWSCGTSTAESIPCMFSLLGQDHYSTAKAKSQESVLDVLQRAGVSVLWRDNNSDCKGACSRIGMEDVRNAQDANLCSTGGCFDGILLKNLEQKISAMNGDIFIVLHQKGSHGPKYFLRTPTSSKQFQPECEKDDITDCSRDTIINAYDNTILYTDKLLADVIELQKRMSTHYDTAMFYMSDHGESLGEQGLYLHGLPYAIAPNEQKHIPFLAWISPAFSESTGLDIACIKSQADNRYSHDNFFHTTLGLLGVQTTLYQPKLDVFNPCRHNR